MLANCPEVRESLDLQQDYTYRPSSSEWKLSSDGLILEICPSVSNTYVSGKVNTVEITKCIAHAYQHADLPGTCKKPWKQKGSPRHMNLYI